MRTSDRVGLNECDGSHKIISIDNNSSATAFNKEILVISDVSATV
jgi:hypothetical protein